MDGFYSKDDSKYFAMVLFPSDSHSFHEFFRAVRLITRTIQETFKKTNWSCWFFFLSFHSAWHSSENGISLNKILFELFSLYFHPLYCHRRHWFFFIIIFQCSLFFPQYFIFFGRWCILQNAKKNTQIYFWLQFFSVFIACSMIFGSSSSR